MIDSVPTSLTRGQIAAAPTGSQEGHCSALSAAGRACVHPVGHLSADSPRLHWDGSGSVGPEVGPPCAHYWGELQPGRREVVALGYAEDISRGATYRVLSWLPGTARSVRHADTCDHTRAPCAGGPECIVGPGVAGAVFVEDDAGGLHLLGRDCAAHVAVPFAPVEPESGAIGDALPDVVAYVPGSTAQGEWVIEPPAGHAPRYHPPVEPDSVGVQAHRELEAVIDPQHGLHYAPYHLPPPDAAACSWAWCLEPNQRTGRVVLRVDASGGIGVDDAVAAAAFAPRASIPSRETLARIRLVADADNAVTRAGLGDWAPGQAHLQVSDGPRHLPGLWRICACRSISLPRRVQLVWQWCLRGEVDLTSGEREALGVVLSVESADEYPAPVMRALTTLAREQLATDRAGLTIRLWGEALTSPMGNEPGDPPEYQRGEITPTALTTGEVVSYLCRVPEERRFPRHTDSLVLPMDRRAWPDLGCRPLVALVSGPGRGAFALGYDVAPICVAVSPPDAHGARLVTVGRATNARQVTLDFAGLVARLSHLEREALGTFAGFAEDRATEWGGNPKTLVLGSPKPGGTYVDPDLIVRTVLDFSAWQEVIGHVDAG